MRRALIVALVAAAALAVAGCGSTAQSDRAHDRLEFKAGCVEEWVKKGGSKSAAQAMCGCATDRFFALIAKQGITTLRAPDDASPEGKRQNRILVAAALYCARTLRAK
jgi:hypothetical protein